MEIEDINIVLPECASSLKGFSLESFKLNVLKVIEETFVYTADQDYLAARMLAFNGMERMFFWSASQCIEKYLKAIILQQGKSVKDLGHDLIKLFDTARSLLPVINDFSFEMNNEFQSRHSTKQDLYWNGENVRPYIDSLKTWGNPNNRYNEEGLKYFYSDLMKLDQLVAYLRECIYSRENLEQIVAKLKKSAQEYLFRENDSFSNSPPLTSINHSKTTSFSFSTPRVKTLQEGFYGYENCYQEWLEKNTRIIFK